MIFARCLSFLAMFILVVVPAFAFESPSNRLTSSQELQIEDRISQLMAEQGIPGVSVAVATKNVLRYAKAFGLVDVENNVAATVASKFRTASVAKPMTATVVLSLAEAKNIDLDAEVQRYCPAYPPKQWPLTTRRLLGHLAGVRHYRNSREASSTRHFYSLQAALETFGHDPLLHEPGTKFHYSSFGYNLLGSIAEGATSQSFADLLDEKVLVPAGMLDTVIDDQVAIIASRARGYIRPTQSSLEDFPDDHHLKGGELYNAALHDTSMKIPGGGLLSTPSDLVRFAVALNTGKLLTDETRRAMWTNQKTVDGESTGYGLGWFVATRDGQDVVWHTGGQSGTSTVLWLIPTSGTSVAMMCNLQNTRLKDAASGIGDLIQRLSPNK